MNKKITEIKVEKIDSRNFIDKEIETLEKYTDKKTDRVLGYYKSEIYYAPHNAERITEEEFFKNLGIKKIKNNYDKIKQMSVDEMATWITLCAQKFTNETIGMIEESETPQEFDAKEYYEKTMQFLLQEVEE